MLTIVTSEIRFCLYKGRNYYLYFQTNWAFKKNNSNQFLFFHESKKSPSKFHNLLRFTTVLIFVHTIPMWTDFIRNVVKFSQNEGIWKFFSWSIKKSKSDFFLVEIPELYVQGLRNTLSIILSLQLEPFLSFSDNF